MSGDRGEPGGLNVGRAFPASGSGAIAPAPEAMKPLLSMHLAAVAVAAGSVFLAAAKAAERSRLRQFDQLRAHVTDVDRDSERHRRLRQQTARDLSTAQTELSQAQARIAELEKGMPVGLPDLLPTDTLGIKTEQGMLCPQGCDHPAGSRSRKMQRSDRPGCEACERYAAFYDAVPVDDR